MVKKNITNILILVLLGVILLQKCDNNTNLKEKPIYFRDTSYVKISGDTVINKTVIKPTEVIPYVLESKDTQYIPDTNYNNLRLQYEQLRDSILTTKIYNDTFKIATLGDARIKTTVFKNNITEQKFSYNIKYPVIKDCVIVTKPSVNQIFIGIGVQGNPTTLVNQLNGQILFKSKKDKVIGVQAGISTTGTINYGINTFWKLK